MSVASQQIDRAIAAAGRLDPERRELFAEFATVFLNGVGSHRAGGEDVLSAMALEAFAWIPDPHPPCGVGCTGTAPVALHFALGVRENGPPLVTYGPGT